jgi:hypothetical protein
MQVSCGEAFDMPVPSPRLTFSGVNVTQAVAAVDTFARLLDDAPPGAAIWPER